MCFGGFLSTIFGKRVKPIGEDACYPISSAQYSHDSRTAKKLSAKIDRKLLSDRVVKGLDLKLLLLGNGESGKSTIMKQMKVIHNNGFSRNELLSYKKDIQRNLLESIQQLIGALSSLPLDSLSLNGEELEHFYYLVQLSSEWRVSNGSLSITPPPFSLFVNDEAFIKAIKALWKESGIRNIYDYLSRSNYIICQAPYFLDHFERIIASNYFPTVSDVLRARIKTTGISEARFPMGTRPYSPTLCMIDVGGQISERKKWIHCFESVTAILFCVSLSEYDQVLAEDPSKSRLLDSLQLFASIANSQWFRNTIIILFLNKIDLFRTKLMRAPLSEYFEDYTGPSADVDSAVKFIQAKFLSLNHAGLPIYTHITCATDTSQMETVFAAIKETIFNRALSENGLL